MGDRVLTCGHPIRGQTQGTNAIVLANKVIHKVNSLKGRLVPADVHVTVTRNYGETASEKSNELLLHMMIAIFSVAALIWVTLDCERQGSLRLPSRSPFP